MVMANDKDIIPLNTACRTHWCENQKIRYYRSIVV